MRTIRKIIWTAGAVLAASLLLAPELVAQTDSVVQVTAEAQGLVSAPEMPLFGTFWEITDSGVFWPTPCALPDAGPVYTLADGSYLVDGTTTNAVTESDLEAQATAVLTLIQMAQTPPAFPGGAIPMARLTMLSGSLAGSYAYGNAVYLENLAASLAPDGRVTASFSVTGGTNCIPYDILSSTNLANPLSAWTWIGIAYTSNSYSFPEQPAGTAFYILAKPSQTMTVGFGDDESNQCDVPYGLTNILQVAGGYSHSLALLANGTVVAWGGNYFGQTDVPTNLTGVTMVAAGWYHSVALLTNGTVTGWGFNLPGFGYPLTEVPSNLTNATVISAQEVDTLALRKDGTVEVWGYNADGVTNVPANATNIVAISAGGLFNLAATAAGRVIAWGNNDYGQCTVPGGLSNVVDVAAGLVHSLALLNNGTVVAWGDDEDGETNVPPGLSNVVAIAASGDSDYFGYSANYSMALKSDGTVVVWGDDEAVLPVGGLSHVISIAGGADYALAIRTGLPTPVITVEPTIQNQLPGGNVTFTAKGEGLYGVTYQWQTNGVDISSATNAELTVTNVQPALSNNVYAVMVTDNAGAGSLESSNANLIIDALTPPVILSETLPTNLVVLYRTYVTLNVEIFGAEYTNGYPLNYQWQFDGASIPGATGSSYSFIANGSVSGNYSVQVTNAAGSTNASWQVTVLDTNGLMIVRQPADQYQIAGGTITFASGAVSTNAVNFQWQFDGTNLAGATNALLTLTNVQSAQQGTYDVVVGDSVNTLTSSNASFVLVTLPVVTAQTPPTSVYLLPDTFTNLGVTAASFGQTNGFPLSYQWQINGTNVPGQTFSNYSFYSVSSGIYSVQVTNAAGATNASWQVNVLNPGSVWAWGENEDDDTAPPAGLTNVVALAAGLFNSLAVEDNGTVIEWGYNTAVVPADLTNAVAVAAGLDWSLALRRDGTVATWGEGDANFVPAGLAGVKAIAAGFAHNMALLTNGTVAAWGYNWGAAFGFSDDECPTNLPSGLTNVTAIAAGAIHSLALMANGGVVAWGEDSSGATVVPADATNVVAVAAGTAYSLALKANGTVEAWGEDGDGQCDVPAGLSNVIAIAAGDALSVALKNDGTVVAWGSDGKGETNTPGLTHVKLIAAGGSHTLAEIFSRTAMYPVDVTKDLLLVYNTNSTDSAFVLNYYLAHRPMVGRANVLGISWPGIYIAASDPYNNNAIVLTNTIDYESIFPSDYTNYVLNPVLNWLAANPTLRPQYVELMYDVPSRINTTAFNAINYPFYSSGAVASVSYQLATGIPNWQPFITHINMYSTNDCIAYINKLQYFGTNYSPGKIIISASGNGYVNTNYVLDNIRDGSGYGSGDFTFADLIMSAATNSLLSSGVSPNSIQFFDGLETIITNSTSTNHYNLPHPTGIANVAGYACWGAHSSLAGGYAVDGVVDWDGDSGWYLMGTVESYNGQRYEIGQGNFTYWFTSNAFGGANYSNTPVGAVSHVDEPLLPGIESYPIYFGLWAAGKNFAICAWAAKETHQFQATGDPFIAH